MSKVVSLILIFPAARAPVCAIRFQPVSPILSRSANVAAIAGA
jgi:hypothetical protein